MWRGSPPDSKRYGVSGNRLWFTASNSTSSGSLRAPFISLKTTPLYARRAPASVGAGAFPSAS